MNIGIIGSGEMGSCLASKLTKLGHTVSVANSRGPALEELVKDKEVVMVSIPQKNIPLLPKALFKDLPVVIDTGNYYPNLRDGNIPALDQGGVDSLWVQEQLGIPVVKVFNSILATSLKDKSKPKGEKDRIALAVSGDDAKAKEIVFKLVDDLGFDPFDLGTIAQSWKQQPGAVIYCRDLNLEELKRRVDTMPDLQSVITKRKADEVLMKADYPAYLKSLQH
ncbi:NADPH-dependent F420 reductase [Chitinophaga niabensis]|uniref:Pyrroline-5-carboxylate reductase catalytic N-terminal domain-containing protein n=1 Tax=Chitinophaga niabensis TaxID=536979 RepID=A0A1N6D0H1_9BACT|nr:NAD(P)-binding domain-containing protein [Chitinophaga niabensis]SIN64203.1 hypothetical protein SAMN04488055_0022 [Chitinophaga niabensis]